jgi:hypothetical protein
MSGGALYAVSSFERPIVIRPGKPNVRTTFQLAATLQGGTGASVAGLETVARGVVLNWLREKFPQPIPHGAYSGDSFDSEEHGQSITCVSVPEEGVWTVRLSQPDTPFRGRAAVAGRHWITDLALRRRAGHLTFAARVQCASLEFADHPIVLTRPHVVKALATRFSLVETRAMDGAPWHLRSFDDLREFESFLLDPMRTLPVILLTQPDRNRLHVGVQEFLLDPVQLARDLMGFGYVATLPRDLGFDWTDLVGKPWSAFLGAVRTYMPGFDYDRDTPSMHPLTFAEKILFWRHFDEEGEHKGEQAFQRFLAKRAKEFSASRSMDWRGCLFVAEAKPIQLTLARQRTHDDGEWKVLYEQEIASLKQTVEGLHGEVNEWLEVAMQAEKKRDFFKDENAQLRARIAWLDKALSERGADLEEMEEPHPAEYEGIADWAARRFAGKLVLHARALRGLKKAEYEDIGRVCDALHVLATHYRDSKLGFDGAAAAFEARCAELEMRCSGSISEERAGEEGETYYVNFPPHSSRKHFVESHLRKGTSTESRYCLAIYFFWHDETQQVVVAWLPSHLQNRLS